MLTYVHCEEKNIKSPYYFCFVLLFVPNDYILLLQLTQTNIWMTRIKKQSSAGTSDETQFPKVPFW